MKRRWILALLLGVVIGTGIGFGLAFWLVVPPTQPVLSPQPKRGAVLDNFKFEETAAKAGNIAWKVVPDHPEFRKNETSSHKISMSSLRGKWTQDELSAT